VKPRVTLPWNAAAWRQNTYAPRVDKVVGPAGEKIHPHVLYRNGVSHEGWHDPGDHSCKSCGYHVCSCKPVANALCARCGLRTCACKMLDHKPEPREWQLPNAAELAKAEEDAKPFRDAVSLKIKQLMTLEALYEDKRRLWKTETIDVLPSQAAMDEFAGFVPAKPEPIERGGLYGSLEALYAAQGPSLNYEMMLTPRPK
jgi:hypothetical protein